MIKWMALLAYLAQNVSERRRRKNKKNTKWKQKLCFCVDTKSEVVWNCELWIVLVVYSCAEQQRYRRRSGFSTWIGEWSWYCRVQIVSNHYFITDMIEFTSTVKIEKKTVFDRPTII